MKEKLKKKCFTITIDGKAFGPYLDRYRYRVAYMENKLGATFQTMFLTEWEPWMKAAKTREKIDNSTPAAGRYRFSPVPQIILTPAERLSINP